MLILFLRTVIMYGVLILSVRLTGKRQLGDLEPAELITTILISELAAVPLQDIDAPLIGCIISISALVCLEVIITVLSTNNPTFSRILQGKYTVIIRDGKIDQKNMLSADISYEELEEAIRQNGALEPADVRYCIAEASGKLSVILKSDLEACEIPLPLILKGRYMKNCLKEKGIKRAEIDGYLKKKGLSKKDVFCMTIADGKYTLIPYERSIKKK